MKDFLEKLLNGQKVEWKRLGEVTQYEQHTKYLVKTKNYDDVFHTPVLTAGKTFILGYTYETNGINKASENPVIIFDDFTAANKWVDFDFKAKSSAMKLISSSDNTKFILKYVYYWMNTLPSDLINGDHKRQWISNFCNKKLPIPPLEVQEEIVRILDSFTEYTTELTTELAVRKKQYNYYRDKLLTFADGEAEWKRLGEVGEFIRGGNLQKKDFTETGVGCIHYGQIYTHYGLFTNKTKTFVSAEFAKRSRKAQFGNLVIATTSENDEDVCKAVAWLGNEDIAVSSDACIYKHTLNPKYVSYFFQTDQFQKQKKQYITGAKVRRVNADILTKLTIPIPPLEVQEEIVRILDSFTEYTTHLKIQLKKELADRQKQYEYYRNQLLNFD